MKYVKVLKNNEYSVFEVIEEYEKTIKCKLTNCENGYIVIDKNNVVKRADTIEKLCDEFVVFDKEQPNGKLLYYKGFENLKNEFIDFENDKCKVEIYGAIWTNKGLIYVAKMDNEGKLVLI